MRGAFASKRHAAQYLKSSPGLAMSGWAVSLYKTKWRPAGVKRWWRLSSKHSSASFLLLGGSEEQALPYHPILLSIPLYRLRLPFPGLLLLSPPACSLPAATSPSQQSRLSFLFNIQVLSILHTWPTTAARAFLVDDNGHRDDEHCRPRRLKRASARERVGSVGETTEEVERTRHSLFWRYAFTKGQPATYSWP